MINITTDNPNYIGLHLYQKLLQNIKSLENIQFKNIFNRRSGGNFNEI